MVHTGYISMLIFGVKRLLWRLDIFLFSYLWIYFAPVIIYVVCYTQLHKFLQSKVTRQLHHRIYEKLKQQNLLEQSYVT